MELKLYHYLRREGQHDEIVDFREKAYQDRLENYDTTLGLDNDLLSDVKAHLRLYNKFLATQNRDEVRLRYYQILALYYTALYFKKRDDHDFVFSPNSIAYWMATGSGKTIIMHLNVLQYLAQCKGFRDFELIMTTPGVNLIEQHERELTPFIEYLNGGKYNNRLRLTIDTTQALTNKPDDFFAYPSAKTYQRLILVDEAHIGLSTTGSKGTDGAFMELRRRLNINNSFLFEYSATFHNINSKLEREYERSIVFDYNYNLFYRDGYGKDYYFQQIGDDVLEGSFDDNLHHNLRIINEKIELHGKIDYAYNRDMFRAVAYPDKPLIAFMGNTVNNKTKSDKNEDPEVSDITGIVNFLADLTDDEKAQYRHVFNDEYRGRLTLTRNPETEDEILLSYGNGGYWGIVNVGNGAKFINDLEHERVVKIPQRQVVISNPAKYSFQNIDLSTSPINVLIGSRKFAEGWNCFRVSVIGLINLGSSKGNKIIQIFGRGVRIKGIKNDGKRTFSEHNKNYYALNNTNDKDRLRKVETLNVLSLKKSYLETFTKAVNQELEIELRHEVMVSPSIIKLNDHTEVHFEEFSKRLPVFKLSKSEIGQRRVTLSPADHSFRIDYLREGAKKEGTVRKFKIKLDYRPDRKSKGKDVCGDVSNFVSDYGAYIDRHRLERMLHDFEEEHAMYLHTKGTQGLSPETMLPFVDEIQYKSKLDQTDIGFVQRLLEQVLQDFLKKLRNKVNWYINSSHYTYDEPLRQSTETLKGDFIDRYYLLKTVGTVKENGKFKKPAEINADIQQFEETIEQIVENLSVPERELGRHIYHPLLRETIKNRSEESDLKIGPDKLNAGEKKFVVDAAAFFRDNPLYEHFEIYLMRNVESLKSIGIYLDDDTQVFYPDFLLWMIGKDKIYLNFIDPKGQMGMTDPMNLLTNEKVKIADKQNNETLRLLETELTKAVGKPVVLNSFLLLRDSSVMGTVGAVSKYNWQRENMINNHILRLNWHATDEGGQTVAENKLPEGKSYLEWMMDRTIGAEP